MYYLCSENKGADQLCSYCTADLRLCFRIRRLFGFLMQWLLSTTCPVDKFQTSPRGTGYNTLG